MLESIANSIPICPCNKQVEPENGRVPLCLAKAGGKVKVACIKGDRGLCARMAALGIYPGAEMQLLCRGCGCPCLVRINGGTLSLGEGVSDKILVTPAA